MSDEKLEDLTDVYEDSDSDSEDDFFKSNQKILPAEDIFSVRCKIESKNKYQMTEVQNRAILLCGKTRSGKSTCMEVLKNPTYIPKLMNIFSGTETAMFYDFAVQMEDDVSNVSIKAIDTPGLFEVKEIGKEARGTTQILNIIAQCLENEICYLHAIFFFITFEAGVSSEDIKSIKLLLEMFGKSKVKFGLVVTRCESKSKEWKMNIAKQIGNHRDLKEIVKNNDMKIFFSGAVSPYQSSSAQDLEEKYKSVYRMRTKLLKYIFNLNIKERAMLREMPFIKNRMDELKKKIEFVTKEWQYFLKEKRDVTKEKDRIKEIKTKIDIIYESKKFIVGLDMKNEKNFVLFQSFSDIGMKLSKTSVYNKQTKRLLLGGYFDLYTKQPKL